VLVAALLYILVVPLVFWSIYGEGASSDRIGSLPVSIFIGEWGALVIVLTICALGFFKNVRRRNLRNAKSFLVIALIVTGLYLLREYLYNIPFKI
jgi:ABC-type microcin C transport system permease subunit YejB